MAATIRDLNAGRMIVPELPGIERARKAEEVAPELGPAAETAPNLAAALEELPKEGVCIICGSLFLLAEFFRLRPDCLGRRT
jgi:dihydrofolate synthase/folylpolyglutamate synthase